MTYHSEQNDFGLVYSIYVLMIMFCNYNMCINNIPLNFFSIMGIVWIFTYSLRVTYNLQINLTVRINFACFIFKKNSVLVSFVTFSDTASRYHIFSLKMSFRHYIDINLVILLREMFNVLGISISASFALQLTIFYWAQTDLEIPDNIRKK